ncbi:sigma-70 family RNA polymerase sigma factor [Parapedobacter lycopersici]|uniref:RNA polymerase sigma factor n=1 Tax=Parapedobacter lycopersici TaxID=1864939 RepID=UPI0033413725
MASLNIEKNQDSLLLQQIASGNRTAFGQLYEKYWSVAYLKAFKRLRNEDYAKDVVQEIFVNIWSREKTPIANFPAYLNVSIRNQVLKLIARERYVDGFFDCLHETIPSYLTADTNVQRNEFYTSYERVIDALPPKRRLIFKLRHHDDLTTKVIASRLGLSIKTVQNQLGKAAEQLKGSLPRFLVLFTAFGGLL